MKNRLLFTLICLLGMGAMQTAKAEKTFYGVLTDKGQTLKCYYDDKMAERGGANPFKSEWKKTVTNAIFDESVKDFHPTNSIASLFSNFKELMVIHDFDYLNTEDVKLMNHVFNGCEKLISVNLSKLKTGNVTTMKSMFRHCSSLTSIDVTYFDTKNVTDMSFMFDSCVHMTTLDVSKFNTQNVTDMQSMFRYCTSLNFLDLKSFDTRNVKRMNHMFYHCSSLSFLYVDNFDTRRVTSMKSMFSGCSGIGMLDVSMFATSSVTDMSYMFCNCTNLKILNVNKLLTGNVTNMSYMFKNCKLLDELDVYSFNVQKVDSMLGMFEDCSKLTTIYTDKDWKTTSKTTSAKSAKMFSGCDKLTGGYGTKYSDLLTADITYARPDRDGIKGYFTEIKEIYGVLSADGKTFTLRFDEERIANKGMTPDEWQAYELMEARENVETIVFDETMNVATPTKIAYWFDDFWNATSVENIHYLHTDNVTDMTWLFNNCVHLEAIDVSGFNTSKVTKAKGMFKGCKALTELDLNSFNMQKVTDVQDMFNGCSELTTILCTKDWSSLGITQSTNMFKNCKKVKGYDGTTYDESHLDVGYARLDGKNGKKGYFSAVSRQVTFVDYNDDVLFVETVVDGEDAKGPYTDPEREGYIFTGWDRSLENITADITITATYEQKSYTVTIEKPENGEIIVLTDEIDLNKVYEGTTIFLEAVPDDGFGLVSWTNYNPETGLVVTSDITVTATFGIFTYVVTIDDEIENGEVHLLDFDIDLENVRIGTTLHFEAVPNTGYELDSWINYDEETGLKVTSDITVSATFKLKTFVVTLDAAEHGHIELDEKDIDLEHVPYGTVLHFTAVPDEGYEFAGWDEYDPDNGLKVTEDVTVSVYFKEETITYMITAVSSNEALGDVTLTFEDEDVVDKGDEPCNFTVKKDAVGHLVATPKDKYTEFVIWNDDKEDIYQAERDITVTGDFDYIATFHKDSFNVVVTVEGIDPELVVINGAGKYGRGDNVTLTFKMEDEHYDFEEWHFDKNNFEDEATLVFEEIDADHDVQIVFKAKYYTVSATVIPAEGGIVKGQGDYEYGSTYTLTLEPAEGWELKEWRDGEALEETSNVLTGLVYGDITIECVLQQKIIYYTVTFLDWDGTFLFSEKVEEGHDAKGTEITPTREGYTFTGWSKPITNITADLTVIALYEQNPPTGVENTEYRIQNTDKILCDGRLYIVVGDRIYDATGRLVK